MAWRCPTVDSRLRAIASMATVLENQVPEGASAEERAVSHAANGALPTISVLVDGEWLMGAPVGERTFLHAVRQAANSHVPAGDSAAERFCSTSFSDPGPSEADSEEAMKVTSFLYLSSCHAYRSRRNLTFSSPPTSVRLDSVVGWCLGVPERRRRSRF